MYRVFKISGPHRPYEGVELLGLTTPHVGATINLYRTDSDARVFTSGVKRVFEVDGFLYAQTHNCVYRFEWVSDLPEGLRTTG